MIKRATACVQIVLSEPREFTYTPTKQKVTGTFVEWRHDADTQHGYDDVRAVLFADDFKNTTIARSEEEAPAWCPLPPKGWDDHVKEATGG